MDWNSYQTAQFDHSDFVIKLESYTSNRLNTESFLPNSANTQSFFSQLDTLYLQPFYTFIYLNHQTENNSNFLEYFDTVLFGEQLGLSYAQKLRWFQHYRKESSENVTLFNPTFFKDVSWSDKTNENQKVYLYLRNKDSTMSQAYTSFRQANLGLNYTGTILESYDTFVAKWNELLERALEFRNTEHHPVYNGTHIWNQLPLSLRRKWKQRVIDSTDPFFPLVNLCVANIFYHFFEIEQNGSQWPIYEGHGLPPQPFDPKYFQIAGSGTTDIPCIYASLPGIWEQLNGRNEIEGKWKAIQWILSRFTQVFRIPSSSLSSLTTPNQATFDQITATIRNVDRTQRFGAAYSQTLAVDSDPTRLPEISFLFNNTQLYSQTFIDTQKIVTDSIPRIPTTDHRDYRYTYDTQTCDTSPFRVSLDYLQTVNTTTDPIPFIEPSPIYESFNVGMVDDPRVLQESLYGLDGSLRNAMRYAETYLTQIAQTQIQFSTYLNEFFYRAVPSSVTIDVSSIGAAGSPTRIAFYNSIQSYLLYYLKNRLQNKTGQVGDLSYHHEIRKLTYDQIIELQESQTATDTMLSNLVTYDPNNELQNNTITTIENRHTTSLGANTSEIHPRSIIRTPFRYLQISNHPDLQHVDPIQGPQIPQILYDWNETSLFPSSYDPNFGCLTETQAARRYVHSGTSVEPIRRPITYGESVQLGQSRVTQSSYWSVSQPRRVIGNYGIDYINSNPYQTTTGLDPILLDTQTFTKDQLFSPYDVVSKNLDTVSSVVSKTIYIPMYGILSNRMDRILPRWLASDSYVECVFRLHRVPNFYTEWSSARNLQNIQLNRDIGNYYIRDSSPSCGVSEFEYRDPFAIEMNPLYLRSIVQTIDQSTTTDVSDLPSLRGDRRNFREQLYKMWCGYPMVTQHYHLSIPETIDTIQDRVIPQTSLPWYSRYKRIPLQRRFQALNQIDVSYEYHPRFHFDGFKFTPESNAKRIDQNSYTHPESTYQTISNIQLESSQDSVGIPTIKKIQEIVCMATHGTKITKQRGISDELQRIMYFHPNQSQYAMADTTHPMQRYLDGGGLWLGTSDLATRSAQLGIVSEQSVAPTSQFDSNFTFSGESRFPVLVEYPSLWKGLHGTVTRSEDVAPFTNPIERPCLIWSSIDSNAVQRFDPYFFQSILLNVVGEEVAPKKDPTYYSAKYGYEQFEKPTDPNLFGIQFKPGYFDFGSTSNIQDRHLQVVASQDVNAINTDVEDTLHIHFELQWKNILFVNDGMYYTRYLR